MVVVVLMVLMVVVVVVVVVCEKQSDPFQTKLLPVVSVATKSIYLLSIKQSCLENFRVNINTFKSHVEERGKGKS